MKTLEITVSHLILKESNNGRRIKGVAKEMETNTKEVGMTPLCKICGTLGHTMCKCTSK